MTQSSAAVSVVLAVFDGERFIAEALSSIFSQTRTPAEVLVVDDASTDDTVSEAERFPGATVHRLARNGGQAAALNEGVRRSSQEFLAFLDADDVWLPHKLQSQLAAFEGDPSLEAVFGHAQEFAEPDYRGPRERLDRKLPAHLPGSMLIRRAAFERVGGYDPAYTLGSVIDWFSRAQQAGLRFVTLDEVVYRRRLHGKNVGTLKKEKRADYFAVVRAARARKQVADRERRGGAER